MEPFWVTSLGGPLILVPESVCARWGGAPRNYPDEEGDYGRACAVDGYLGLIDVGGPKALVLGDEPASTTFLPALNVLVRATALDDGVDLEAIVPTLLPSARWVETVHWSVTEPVVLFDSAYGGSELDPQECLRLDLPPGEYAVEAAYVERPEAYLILVRLTRKQQ